MSQNRKPEASCFAIEKKKIFNYNKAFTSYLLNKNAGK